MKQALVILSSLLLFSSCKISAPTFKNLGQWQISNLSTSNVTLSNTAYFHNPNSIDGIRLNTVSVNVLANGKKLGTISNSNGSVAIAKNADFGIPLSLNINPLDLIGDIGQLLGAAPSKSIEIRCLGTVSLGFLMLKKSVNIDQTVPIKLSDILK